MSPAQSYGFACAALEPQLRTGTAQCAALIAPYAAAILLIRGHIGFVLAP
jgi:hypothetical protein